MKHFINLIDNKTISSEGIHNTSIVIILSTLYHVDMENFTLVRQTGS